MQGAVAEEIYRTGEMIGVCLVAAREANDQKRRHTDEPTRHHGDDEPGRNVERRHRRRCRRRSAVDCVRQTAWGESVRRGEEGHCY